MDDDSCLGPMSDCYCVAEVFIGPGAVVSQHAYLCSASHDYQVESMLLVAAPITLEKRAWVAARAIIGPGVVVGEGAVVAAGAVAFKSVPAWTVVAGNPAKFVKVRTFLGAGDTMSRDIK